MATAAPLDPPAADEPQAGPPAEPLSERAALLQVLGDCANALQTIGASLAVAVTLLERVPVAAPPSPLAPPARPAFDPERAAFGR